jgi:hypothetical protein
MPGLAPMSRGEHYRRHAETCRRLARCHADTKWAPRLIGLAERYEATAETLDGGEKRCEAQYTSDIQRGRSAVTHYKAEALART